MSYCNNEFYLETYNGKVIPQNQIDKWLMLASSVVRQCILNRDITGFEMLVKNATCNVADILFNQNERTNEIVRDGSISSEHIGDYSRTYASTGDMYRMSKSAINEILTMYLGTTGLMYRGFDV